MTRKRTEKSFSKTNSTSDKHKGGMLRLHILEKERITVTSTHDPDKEDKSIRKSQILEKEDSTVSSSHVNDNESTSTLNTQTKEGGFASQTNQ